ncbi:hypothetical protein GZH53_08405 [Flavihumibacter sp. R14]|nr:hypothetical protein [Flavihumibacter soli]
MSTNENINNPNRNQEYSLENESRSQTQNNNGNIGREEGNEEEVNGSFIDISNDSNKEKPANEEGVRENQEHHWVGNHGQRSSNRPGSRYTDDFSDQNLTDGVQQNSGRNHVTNAGGTSQEDLAKGKTGLTDEENNS